MKSLKLNTLLVTNRNGYTIKQIKTSIPKRDYQCIEVKTKIPLNYGVGIELDYEGESYIMKYNGRRGIPEVVLKVNTWRGMSIGAMHYYGELRINFPEMTSVDGKHTRGGNYDFPMFKNNCIELTQILEQWEKDKYPENYEYYDAGDRHTGFYTREAVIDYGKRVFEQLFAKGWIFKVEER